jgi:2-oxoglutarate ferredoxin oxidoreductase subunit beta
VPDHPLHPLSLAIGAEATFVARTLDTDTKHLIATLERAAAHKGAAFVEVYQNCNVYNDGAFAYLTQRDVHADRTLYLEHGQPMLFGTERTRGIRLCGLDPEIVTLGEHGVTEADILRHDETRPVASLAYILSRLDYPAFPVPVGVLRAVEKPTYDGIVAEQEALALQRSGPGDLEQMFQSGETWVVE